MPSPRGIFGLKQVYEEQLSDNWSVKNDVWLAPSSGGSPFSFLDNQISTPNTGYFGGGLINGGPSIVERIDYSNDTATVSVRAPLSSNRQFLAATSNSSYGWFGGGEFGPSLRYTRVDRIDYSNDLTTASVRGPLGIFSYIAATGNSSYGWFGGGLGPTGGTAQAFVVRIDYSSDGGGASVRGPLSIARAALAATGNSNFGWFGGGYNNLIIYSTIDRIDYSNDTATASPRGRLSTIRRFLTATGNSSYGWFGGGGSPSLVSTVDRITYASDTVTASPRGPLSDVKYAPAATGNSNFGYFGGGGNITYFSIVDRIDYANDTVAASPKGPLFIPRHSLAATSARAYGLPYVDSTLPPTNSPLQVRSAIFYGYFGGGNLTSDIITSIVDRIDYTNDTAIALVRGPFSVEKYALAATGNGSYGYFGAGYKRQPAFAYLSTVDRIDYANDTATASPKGPLSFTRYFFSAVGNSSYGWFSAGFPGPILSSVDRIDYSNDTATASPRGPLSFARASTAATGNSSYGWFGGGGGAVSTVDRIDYSNDTATASPRGPLSLGRESFAATGNSNFGWFGGGYTPSAPAERSTVDRIDYSNDTATASPRGPLSLGRYVYGSTGNSSYGWFDGGAYYLMDRIDYSNDTATASPRGKLSITRGALYATSAAANGLPQ